MAEKAGVSRKTLYLVALGLVAVLWVVGVLLSQPTGSAFLALARGLALLGYLGVFLATLSTAYLRELVKAFGRPFIKIHHVASVTGIVAITLHPLAVAVEYGSQVLVPSLGSPSYMLAWAGRPAWVLLIIGVVVALLRTRLVKSWRIIHYVNYIAFLLGTVHANLLGGNFVSAIPRILSIIMALVVIAVFVRKRVQAAKRPQKASRK